MLNSSLINDIKLSVSLALAEDLGVELSTPVDPALDITASLIPAQQIANASVISRDDCVVCGTAWVNEVFAQLDAASGEQTLITWFVDDGDKVKANTTLFKITGNARLILTGERAALNFLQTLSSTATLANNYVQELAGSHTKLLDTRKTIPGLRSAQKYAITCGGGVNHRIGLFDAYLIKENHINACGGINLAISTAKKNNPDKTIEVEVESLDELEQALNAGADIIMLDNFTPEMIQIAVQKTRGKAKLEVSGNMTLDKLKTYTQAGVDFVSVGALTKHITAVDLSMRFA